MDLELSKVKGRALILHGYSAIHQAAGNMVIGHSMQNGKKCPLAVNGRKLSEECSCQ